MRCNGPKASTSRWKIAREGQLLARFATLVDESELGQSINRRRDRLKLLGWDGQGFWIWYKRLESGVFEKPTADENLAQLEIDVTQLSLIIHGIDLRSAKRRRRYKTAG